jgi:hypothetical protein
VKFLFTAESALVALTGSALVLFPSVTATLLFSSTLDHPVGTAISRATGAILLLLGITCWGWRNRDQSRTTSELIGVMFFHDIALVLVLLYSRFAQGLTGIGTWPAVALHLGLDNWCLASLFRSPRTLGMA